MTSEPARWMLHEPLPAGNPRIAAALVALTVLCAQDPPPSAPRDDSAESATIRGQVTDAQTGQPVEGVRVRAIDTTGRTVVTVCAIDDCNRAKPVSQAIVVLFPDDWTRLGRTRLVRTAFAMHGGRFEVNDVAPGRYRAAAVRWLPRDAWNDGDVLARLWPSSDPITVGGGETTSLRPSVSDAPEDLFR